MFSKNPKDYLGNCPNRDVFSFYLRGCGIEIGALAWPLTLPDGVQCQYMDLHSTEDLAMTYRDQDFRSMIVPVDRVDNGETLTTLDRDSQDFIVANSLLEHVVNVLRALMRWYEILREGGILFLSVPDWRFTVDQIRSRTVLDHLIEEYEQHVEEISEEHCIEHLMAMNGFPREVITPDMIEFCKREGVHNHCWECEDIINLLEFLSREHGVRFQLVDLSLPRGVYNEFILILRRCASAGHLWTRFAEKRYIQQKEMEARILEWISKAKKD